MKSLARLRVTLGVLMLFCGIARAAGSYYGGQFPTATTAFTQSTLTLNGTPRDALVFRPPGVSAPPLLLLFTGTGGTIDYNLLDELGREAMQAFAEREGVVIVAPMPRLMARGDWDNHTSGYYYWETAVDEGTASPVSSDPSANQDLLFVRAIIDEAVRVYGANPARVYFNGFSNGAFFSYFAAAVLHDRVAAFAETGGGLVLSNTAAGDPPCQPQPATGVHGEVRSCSAAGWTPQTCVAPGAIARPIAPSLAGAVPPGYLQANEDDDSVPFAHTCNLAAALEGVTDVQARVVHNGGGHIWNEGFLQNSWDFMKTKSRVQENYSDSWWNANESGWGITLTDHGANAFIQWYTYDQSGHNQKYVISGGLFSSDKCHFNGTVSHVTGPSWTLPSFDPAQVSRNTSGTASIDFCPSGVPAGTIVFNYSVDGVSASKQLTRLSFGNDVPHPGGNANTGGPDFTDLWWNPAESGWGVSVTQHGNNMFFRIFVYDTDNRPLLFVVPGVTVNGPESFTGALQSTTGPYFGSQPFDPSQVVRTTAGSATLNFSDANNGVLSYTVNGATQTKAITRLSF